MKLFIRKRQLTYGVTLQNPTYYVGFGTSGTTVTSLFSGKVEIWSIRSKPSAAKLDRADWKIRI